MGGDRKQYQVLVDPTALHEYDVTLQQVEAALKANNLNASGGFAVERRDREADPRHRPARPAAGAGRRRPADRSRSRPTPHRDRPARNRSPASTKAPQLKRGDASINGHPGVVITVVKQPHADTRGADRRGQGGAARGRGRRCPPTSSSTPTCSSCKDFIDRGIYNVGEALVIGAVLVLIVLFLFLLNFRTTFISLTAIPLSLVVTDAGVPADRAG